MKIPGNCKSWQDQLKNGNPQDQKLLENIENENCIKKDVCDEFFEHLATKGAPGTPKKARDIAIDIIMDAPDKFVCQGRKIPSTSFIMLIRLEDVKKLSKHFPNDYLRSFGIRDLKTLNINDLPDDDLRIMIEMYDGELKLGNRLDIVWVSDSNKSYNIKSLIDRLGIAHLENEERCLKIVYRRDIIEKSLHLPRSFDGIDNEPFEVVKDCKAIAGKTVPLNMPRKNGLPEAVHRGCKVKPNLFELEKIQ